MKNGKLILLGGIAVALAGIACFTRNGSAVKGPKVAGNRLVPAFDISSVTEINVADKLKLVAGEHGWTVETLYGYPADKAKIADHLLALADVKVGQVVRGRKLGTETSVVIKGEKGELASVTLGEKHEKYGRGRYAAYKGETVLVKESLDEFDGDAMAWVDTKLIDDPSVNFKAVLDPSLTDETCGFTTGVVKSVTIAGITNRLATVGGIVPGGSDRYLKLDGQKWIYAIPSYAAERIAPPPKAAGSGVEVFPEPGK